jgi:hypothetical protein
VGFLLSRCGSRTEAFVLLRRRHLLLIIMGNNLLHCCTDKTAQLLTDPPPRIEQPKLSPSKRPSFSSSSGLYKDLRSYETSYSASSTLPPLPKRKTPSYSTRNRLYRWRRSRWR